jgi:glyoxylase-like metal-dependent hydrolase (beta-lactamase superfamily II)
MIRMYGALLLVGAMPLAAQSPATSLESYRRARTVLDAAITAHGGRERLAAIRTISLRHEGTTPRRNQSPSVNPPYAATPTSGLLVLDLAGGRLIWENRTLSPGAAQNHTRLVYSGREGWQASMPERRWFALAQNAPSPMPGLARRLPHLVVLGALERSAQLRWQGRATYAGRPHDVITYPTVDDDQQIALYLDARTHLLAKFEQLITDPQTGDAVLEVGYRDYRPVSGIPMPTRRVVRRVGAVVEDVRYADITIDGPVPEDLLRVPEGFVDGTSSPAADTTLLTLAPDVYLVQGVAGANNALAVAFNDHILVAEAYGSDAASQRTIRILKAAVPNKPIRYLIPTHYHDDHTGGVRTFIAEGTTIVTTPGNRGYFETMARGTFTMAPDLQSRVRAPLKLETIQGKRRVFTDGTHTVEAIDIGPSPHADEMVVIYLPKERILMQGDLLNRTPDRRPRIGTPITKHFLDWLERSGLAVERIIPVHGPEHTIAEVREAVRLGGL